jgi:hypothetical protein
VSKRRSARTFDIDDPFQAQYLVGPVGAENPRSVLDVGTDHPHRRAVHLAPKKAWGSPKNRVLDM